MSRVWYDVDEVWDEEWDELLEGVEVDDDEEERDPWDGKIFQVITEMRYE